MAEYKLTKEEESNGFYTLLYDVRILNEKIKLK